MFPLSRFLGRSDPKERELFDFLKSVETDMVPHYRKSLFAHLVNTYSILKAWGCEPHICHAGLFHSVYGTQMFKTQTVPYEERQRIRDLIGEPAERLAYLFSVSDRPQGLLRALETLQVSDTVRGERVRVTPTELSELLLIECANLKDQKGLETFCCEALQCMNKFRFPASPAHLQLVRNALSEARANHETSRESVK